MTRSRPDGYTLSDDPARLDFAVVQAALAASYWSPGIARETVERAAAGSLAVGLYAPESGQPEGETSGGGQTGGEQVGYARAVSDRATFAYLADVFVLDAHRGRGLGRWLVDGLLGHPDLQGLRRWMLATRDAHGLYAQVGFAPVPPGLFMHRSAS